MRYRYTIPMLCLVAGFAAPAVAQDAAPPPPAADEASAAPMPDAAPAPTPDAMESPATADQTAVAGPTPAQTLSMSEWPAEKRTAYAAWPADVQTYYWSLSEPRQGLFWRLADQDKVKLAAIPPASQPQAWDSIEKLSAQPQDGSSAQSDEKPQGPGR